MSTEISAQQHSGPKSFFERERDKLVAEIAEGLESILSNSNTLNRKLEESISVGKEFEPIAGLWGQFADLMARAGIPDANVSGADTGSEERGSATTGTGSVVDDALGGSRGAEEPKLPPGVAPGGGTVYGREAQ